jgi:alkanesulfonate monooxygenase SsuD/methylene tetrahydromethanopterin reductase-like flavin-dependent oxidoreductase (luciferase family)
MTPTGAPVGLVLGSAISPDRLRPLAQTAEAQGFCEIWVSEDYFFTGGISGSAIVLGATDRLPVGLGVVSAVARHPAVLAMEISTLAQAFPGRLMPTVGLGVPAWLRQMGLHPRSPLAAVRETVTSLRALLAGEQLDNSEGLFTFQAVQLTHPMPEGLPLRLGVAGQKMLQLSGELADGTVLSVLSSPTYVRWAREQIEVGAARAGREAVAHDVTTFAICCVDADGNRARAAVRPVVAFYLAAGGPNALTDAYGISRDLQAMLDRGGVAAVEREMPDEWLADLAVAGTPTECAHTIQRLLDAGSDRVAVFPMPDAAAESIVRTVSSHVLPLIRGADPHPAGQPEGTS